jgi:L-alanine-DL-glutamate epimerase-like enolase superfamily enzyme
MVGWLAEHQVVLVEQPLPPLEDPEADAAGFAALELDCPIALVADESCWDLADLVRLAPFVDGVNIKLLKSGGLGEALLLAQACAKVQAQPRASSYPRMVMSFPPLSISLTNQLPLSFPPWTTNAT